MCSHFIVFDWCIFPEHHLVECCSIIFLNMHKIPNSRRHFYLFVWVKLKCEPILHCLPLLLFSRAANFYTDTARRVHGIRKCKRKSDSQRLIQLEQTKKKQIWRWRNPYQIRIHKGTFIIDGALSFTLHLLRRHHSFSSLFNRIFIKITLEHHTHIHIVFAKITFHDY